MENVLTDREWQYLLQIIYRLNQCKSYEEFGRLAMEQLRTLIPFRKALMMQKERFEGKVISKNPICINPPDLSFDEQIYMDGPYRGIWFEYMYSPWSTVIRDSDHRVGEEWERSPVYRDIWKPQGIHFGLHCMMVYEDRALGMLSLFRGKDVQDFSDKELYILDALKVHLAQALDRLIVGEKKELRPAEMPSRQEKISQGIEAYRLTRQEGNIARLILEGKSDGEICEQLFISPATLRRHIYNIYQKTNVKNRVRFMQLFL